MKEFDQKPDNGNKHHLDDTNDTTVCEKQDDVISDDVIAHKFDLKVVGIQGFEPQNNQVEFYLGSDRILNNPHLAVKIDKCCRFPIFCINHYILVQNTEHRLEEQMMRQK